MLDFSSTLGKIIMDFPAYPTVRRFFSPSIGGQGETRGDALEPTNRKPRHGLRWLRRGIHGAYFPEVSAAVRRVDGLTACRRATADDRRWPALFGRRAGLQFFLQGILKGPGFLAIQKGTIVAESLVKNTHRFGVAALVRGDFGHVKRRF